MAASLKDRRNQTAEELVFGRVGRMALGTLLDRMHSARRDQWKQSYREGQERRREFWKDALGKDTPIMQINEDVVEGIVRRNAKRRGWSVNTQARYLRYIRDAWGFGRKKLKAIPEHLDLTALEIPTSQKKGPEYSREETFTLAAALMEHDLRAGVVSEAYVQAGRRLNATRLLTTDRVRIESVPTKHGKVEAVVLSYPADSDKVGRASEAALVGEAVHRVRDLLEMPAVQATGLLMPEGDLAEGAKRWPGNDGVKRKRKPARKAWLIDQLKKVEEAVGIEHIPYRAYHGMKRRFAEVGKANRAIASRQSGTSEETLRDKYEPDDDLQGKVEFAYDVDRLRGEN